MALLSTATDAASRRLPKFVSSDLHRTADYLISGVLIAGGMALFRSDRRAAYACVDMRWVFVKLKPCNELSGKKAKTDKFCPARESRNGNGYLIVRTSRDLEI